MHVSCLSCTPCGALMSRQVERLQTLENEMKEANEEYIQAVNRASEFVVISVWREVLSTGHRKPARTNMRGIAHDAG